MTYVPPPHRTQHWLVTKPTATGTRGMVTSQALAASEAGLAILDVGGNAVDAAIATALAIGVIEPWNSSLGGVGYAVIHMAGDRQAQVIDFGPRAPAALTPDHFVLTGRQSGDLFGWPEVEGGRNEHGPLSFAIPSAVAGYELMHKAWGTRPVDELLAPAIALARRGLPVDWFSSLKISQSAAKLRQYPASAQMYLDDGLPPLPPFQGKPGFRSLGTLADTLQRVATHGFDDFYRGEIARSIVEDSNALGGVLSAEDLGNCRAAIVAPTVVDWHGTRWQMATGLTAAPTIARVVELVGDRPSGGEPDAEWYAKLATAMRTAYAERLEGLGEKQADESGTCTTHVCVCDADGNMVSLTVTLLSSMGSRVVLPDTGILMNNGVMWFDPRPGQPNSIAPGKRPLTNMSPVIMARGGKPFLALGSAGGRRIMSSVVQMGAFIANFGMPPDKAAAYPRIDVSGPDGVSADVELPEEVLRRLEADSRLERVEHSVVPINFALPSAILIDSARRTGVTDVMSPWSAALAQAE